MNYIKCLQKVEKYTKYPKKFKDLDLCRDITGTLYFACKIREHVRHIAGTLQGHCKHFTGTICNKSIFTKRPAPIYLMPMNSEELFKIFKKECEVITNKELYMLVITHAFICAGKRPSIRLDEIEEIAFNLFKRNFSHLEDSK